MAAGGVVQPGGQRVVVQRDQRHEPVGLHRGEDGVVVGEGCGARF
jgi:hypothetical protein